MTTLPQRLAEEVPPHSGRGKSRRRPEGRLGWAIPTRRKPLEGICVRVDGANPTERSSGERQASGGIHRCGRPTLRVVAYQAAVSLVRYNPDFRTRYLALIAEDRPRRLTKEQAHLAIANKPLRTLWSLAVSGEPYRSEIAQGEVRPTSIAA